MLTLYYPPFRAEDDVELLDQTVVGLRAYVEDLVEFDMEILRNAWREVRRAHKLERWPTIEVIRRNCLESGTAKSGSRTTVGDLWKMKKIDERWIARMRCFDEGKPWLREFWGPAPGEDGCQVPAEVLRAFSRDGSQGAAA